MRGAGWARVVRRVLVLIQVAALRAARQAHALHATRLPQHQKCADGCEVAAEPLGDPSHFPVGADIDFVDWGLPLLSRRSAVS